MFEQSLQQLKERLEATKKKVAEEYQRVVDLIKKAEAEAHYLRGQHDALDTQLQQLVADTPPAIVDTAAAVAADSAAAGQSGADLTADVAAVQSTETAVKADVAVAKDVAAVAAAVQPAPAQ